MASFPFHYFIALRNDYVRSAEMTRKAIEEKTESDTVEVDVGA